MIYFDKTIKISDSCFAEKMFIEVKSFFEPANEDACFERQSKICSRITGKSYLNFTDSGSI